MKNLPKRIYLQIDADGERPEDFKDLSGVSWCADKIYDTDIPYVLESDGSEAVEFAEWIVSEGYQSPIQIKQAGKWQTEWYDDDGEAYTIEQLYKQFKDRL